MSSKKEVALLFLAAALLATVVGVSLGPPKPPNPPAMCDCGHICNKNFHCGMNSCPMGH
jgi:hypothetical protein